MFGKDFREDAASAQNVAAMLQIEDEVLRRLAPARASNGTVALEAHLLGKFVDGSHPALGFALDIRNLQRHFRKAVAP